MCGFVGFTGLREQREAILHRMADRIIHRGPDMEGYHISGNDPRSAIALGFRRLSIIDLAAGKQPMYNEDGTVVCVFNGEIYNFMELRTELQAKGHIFQTHCDTEVILHGYEEYGTKLAGMLRGMFAFVVWDTKTNEMYGARDIFGIKPFYYTQTDAGELLFGSEIKTLLAHPAVPPRVDANGLAEVLLLGPGRTPGCGVFKNIRELLPGQCAVYEADSGRLTLTRYWQLTDHDHPDDFETTARNVRDLVVDAIQRQLVSDVPVATFLSGGLDSSLISAVADTYFTARGRQLQTFSVGYKDNRRYWCWRSTPRWRPATCPAWRTWIPRCCCSAARSSPMPRWRFRASAPTKFLAVTHGTATPPCGKSTVSPGRSPRPTGRHL